MIFPFQVSVPTELTSFSIARRILIALPQLRLLLTLSGSGQCSRLRRGYD